MRSPDFAGEMARAPHVLAARLSEPYIPKVGMIVV